MRELQQGIAAMIEALWSPGPVDAVQEFFGPGWKTLFMAISFLGTGYAVVVVASLALWFGGRRLSYSVLGAVVFGSLVNGVLWTLFSVPRPDSADVVVRTQLSVSSFPSGHTMTATVLWVPLAALSRLPWAVPAVVIPAVMLSRLYLGAHFLGDVLATLLIGLSLMAIYLRVWPAIMRWLSRWSFLVFLIVGLCAPFAVLLFIGMSPRGFELFGISLAAGIGLPLEYRYVRFEPTKAPLRWQVLKAVVGLPVIGALLLARGLPVAGPIVDAGLVALATLWGLLLAPALFAGLKLSERTW